MCSALGLITCDVIKKASRPNSANVHTESFFFIQSEHNTHVYDLQLRYHHTIMIIGENKTLPYQIFPPPKNLKKSGYKKVAVIYHLFFLILNKIKPYAPHRKSHRKKNRT
jgi:hypothetical protein